LLDSLLQEILFMMPVVQDWLSNPLLTVSQMFSGGAEPDWHDNLKTFFKERVGEEGSMANIPSINEMDSQDMREGQLVKFRCMVQDMFDPEFFMSQYRVKSLVDGSIKTVTGRYRDTLACGPREEVVDDESSNSMDMTEDRLSFYCVSIPGSAAWLAAKQKTEVQREALLEQHGSKNSPGNSLKRGLEDSDADSGMETEDIPTESTALEEKEIFKKPKNADNSKEKAEPAAGLKSLPNPLNLPLGESHGKAAVVKMYDLAEGEVKLNDLLELVGILSLDPALSTLGQEEDESMGGRGTFPSLPPPSLVPRLHVLCFSKLSLCTPPPSVSPLPQQLAETRGELLSVLSQCLLGDSLAAEYTLLHLLSRLYLRRDVLVLGKFALNLHNVTNREDWPRRLATVLSLFTSHHHFLPLSRAALDSRPFTPVKDFEANRLVTGVLQLPAGMHLTIDETVMTDGDLGSQGLKNLTALGNLITWQKVDYDLFTPLEFPCEVSCLVLSEGRSMLPSDFQVLLQPQESHSNIEGVFRGVGQYLTPSLLTRLREYISHCKHINYTLTDEVMKRVQDDFVQLRQQEGGLTVEEFHNLLVLARLQSISQGHDSMEPKDWEAAKDMERQRKQRASSLPQRPGSLAANGMPLHLNAGEA